MDIVISGKSDKPIYLQIYEQITSQIIKGELKSDYCLPSIRVIASEIGISVITIKKAWELLEANGFIYTKAGKGCFVASHAESKLNDKANLIASEKLDKDLPFYKNLGLSIKELIRLISEKY